MDEEQKDAIATEDEFDLAFGVAVGGEEIEEEVIVADEPSQDEVAAVDEPTPQEEVPAEPTPAPVLKQEPEPKVDVEAVRQAQEAKAEAERLQTEAIAKESLTPEEQAAIQSVSTDFPDTAAALKAVERVAFTKAENAFNAKLKVLEEKFEQKFAQMGQEFAPAIATAQTVAKNAHEAEILKGHADAFEIVPKVEQWANAQPSFLKSATRSVIPTQAPICERVAS